MPDLSRADLAQEFRAAYRPVIEELSKLCAEEIRRDFEANGIHSVRGKLAEFADIYDVSVDFSDYTVDEAIKFNQHVHFNVLDQVITEVEDYDGREAVEVAHAAVLTARDEEDLLALDAEIEAAASDFPEDEASEQDDEEPASVEEYLSALRDEATERLSKEEGELLANEIESYGLENTLRLMNASIGRLAGIEFDDFSEKEAIEFTEYMVGAYMEDGLGADLPEIARESYDHVLHLRGPEAGHEGFFPLDVSNENYRIYTYRDYNSGFSRAVSVVHPLTLTVGEDGEHIFELEDGSKHILPPNFLDIEIVYRDRAEAA